MMSRTEQPYYDLLGTTPRPTAEQVAAFVEYVTSAHSWYKHLPVFHPGAPFVFFVDPNAGREFVGGRYRDRTADTPSAERFHYTWQPTEDYRAAYGNLQYYTDRGTAFYVPTAHGVLHTALVPHVRDEDGNVVALPPAVVEAGTVYLTNTIHPMAQSSWLWMVLSGNAGKFSDSFGIELPSKPPADPIHREIWEFLRSLSPGDGSDEESPRWQGFYERCIRPDLDRQRKSMNAAIEAMLEVVYGPASGKPSS